ncbi:MAG TPA: DUF692 family protein [Bacteriovoracaceae bacterium]|nr:DUF692 family protein [Bacteriovoracaceae bacterium]
MRRRLGQYDLVGLGWRTELAPSILSNLDQIDVVEVIIDDYFKASLHKLRALRTLNSQVQVIYHGVGLGLATSLRVDQKRLDRLAKVVDYLAPEVWSEHLAFVRAGGVEIGHLAAPPRTVHTIEGALENLARIKKTVGSCPVLENIATLIDPPGSKMPESQWVREILEGSNCNLLLDLNNLYTNAVNFGHDPVRYLKSFPLHQVRLVHLSGGKWIPEPKGFESRIDGRRLLDDHIHDVPDSVYDLLRVLAETVPQPLTVIIERDGEFPEFDLLLKQIRKAKDILKEGRSRRILSQRGLLECSVF